MTVRVNFDLVTDWGRILREIREEKELSQRGACSAIGVHRSTLRRVESNDDFDIRVIERLLWFYGYKLDTIKRREAA